MPSAPRYGSRASEIILEDVKVSSENIIGEEGKASKLIEQVVDESIAAVCAEAIGAMGVLNEATVEYCKTRKQFGQPIGKFQVLQHRMVDMFMQYEQSVSMTYMVNLKLHEEYSERRKAASGAKVQICKAAKFIGQSAIQLHGGMGMTDELNVGHYFKRLSKIKNTGKIKYVVGNANIIPSILSSSPPWPGIIFPVFLILDNLLK